MYNSLTDKLTTSRGGAVLLGILAAVLAAILLTVYITNYRSSVKSDTAPTSVLVAKRLIPGGTSGAEIGSRQLYTLETMPKNQLHSGALTDPSALNGQITARAIFRGQQLTTSDFATSDTAAAGVINTQLKANQRAVLIQLDAVNADLANLRPGDHVDIYQQVSSSNGTIIKLFRADVPVLQVTTSGSEGQVALQVAARDAADFLFASKHTELSFVLRPASGATPTPPTTASNETMLTYSRTH